MASDILSSWDTLQTHQFVLPTRPPLYLAGSTHTASYSAAHAPGETYTPLYSAVDPTLPTRLLQGLTSGIAANASIPFPSAEVAFALANAVDELRFGISTEDESISRNHLVIRVAIPMVKAIFESVMHQSVSITSRSLQYRDSQHGDHDWFIFSDSDGATVPPTSLCLEHKSWRALTSHLHELRARNLHPFEKSVNGEAMMIKILSQMYHGRSRFGAFMGGSIWVLVEKVFDPSGRTVLLLSPPLSLFAPPHPDAPNSPAPISCSVVALLVAVFCQSVTGFAAPSLSLPPPPPPTPPSSVSDDNEDDSEDSTPEDEDYEDSNEDGKRPRKGNTGGRLSKRPSGRIGGSGNVKGVSTASFELEIDFSSTVYFYFPSSSSPMKSAQGSIILRPSSSSSSSSSLPVNLLSPDSPPTPSPQLLRALLGAPEPRAPVSLRGQLLSSALGSSITLSTLLHQTQGKEVWRASSAASTSLIIKIFTEMALWKGVREAVFYQHVLPYRTELVGVVPNLEGVYFAPEQGLMFLALEDVGEPLAEQEAEKCLKGLRAVLRKAGIRHQDLTSPNTLRDRVGTVRIIDFEDADLI